MSLPTTRRFAPFPFSGRRKRFATHGAERQGAWRWRVLPILVTQLAGSGNLHAQPASPEFGWTRVTAVTISGEPVRPLDVKGKASVLVFLGVECPISNRYAPELRRLQQKFATSKIDWWMVYPGTNYSRDQIGQHRESFNLPGQALLDRPLALATAVKIRVTPEVAVFLPDGQLAYRGRIDDRFPKIGVERREPTQHDLEEALVAVAAGKVPSVTQTTAIGCRIQGLP